MPFSPSSWHFNVDDYINPWLPSPPWHRLPAAVSHVLGHRSKPPRSLGNLAMIFWAFIGIFASLILVEAVSRAVPSFQELDPPVIVGSFGAAAVLEFYAIESPLAQPRNAVFGQLLASVTGVAIRKLFALGSESRELFWIGGALSCASATAIMALTGTVHPPAGATALMAVVDDQLANLGWHLIPIMLLGCILMQCIALLVNNIQRRFPAYWWTPAEVGQRYIKANGGDKASQPSHSDLEAGAKLEKLALRHIEIGGEQPASIPAPPQVLITRGRVVVPDSMYLTPEEAVFLEELSGRV